MYKKIYVILFLICSYSIIAQELNCNLVVNAQQTGNENVQLFKTLEKQLSDFVNNTKWTNKVFESFERVDCSMVITITNYNSDSFQASIQIQSVRPVYNSNYFTTVYNFNDKDFNFQYLEYQNLNFNLKQFESNLISVIAFHVYVILGMDADTFEFNGGQDYFNVARDIANYSQNANIKGWGPARGGDQSRRVLIDQIMSNTFSEFRTALYEYHRNGLDYMFSDRKKAKNSIAKAIINFDNLYKRRPNSFVTRVFFDAKVDEITDIFSAGPSVKISDLVPVLNKVAPIYSSNWKKIKF